MSHFSKIKTQLTDIEMVKKALEDLGFSYTHNPDLHILGYANKQQQVDLSIRVGDGYEVGLKKNPVTEAYDIVADWYGVKMNPDYFINKLKQRYAYHKVLHEAEDRGLIVSENTQTKDGSLRLTLRQWS